MGRIEELREKLYRKEKPPPREGSEYFVPQEDLYQEGAARKSWKETGVDEKPEKPTEKKRNKKALKILMILGAVSLLILGGLAIFSILGLKKEEVEIEIFSKNEIEAGDIVSYHIRYINKSNSTLSNLEMTFVYPPGSLPLGDENLEGKTLKSRRKVDDLKPGDFGELAYRARIFGRDNDQKTAEAMLFYQPEKVRAKFSKTAKFSTTILRVPLSLSFNITPEVSSGQEVEVVFNYNSSSRLSFENISLRVDYPGDFKFISADPAPTIGDNIWSIGSFSPETSGKIFIRGTLSGVAGETKVFKGHLGVFNSETRQWEIFGESTQESTIFAPPLFVEQKVNGVKEYIASLGEKLNFSVRYINNFSLPIRNVVVSIDLSSPVLDLTTLDVERGFFDAVEKKIIWNPGNLSELREVAPGQGGEFKFLVKIKPRPPIKSAEDKNFVVVSRANIETNEPPRTIEGLEFSYEDKVEVKVNTEVIFTAKALYHNSPVANSGPLPPQVDKTTTYTILWEVRNFSNDVRNFQVKAVLPPNIKWTSKVSPQNEPISFDPKSSEIVWEIGKLEAGTGILTSAKQAAFQVSLTPALSDRGKPVVLIGETRAFGIDNFTDKIIEALSDKFTTELKDDPETKFGDWKVAQ